MKRRLVTLLQVRVINPRNLLHAGNSGRPDALLETVGRKSGKPHQIPVANGLDGSVFWIVAMHGRGASYVQNLIANPRVRVKVAGAWRPGTAQVVPDDDPIRRLESIDPRTATLFKRIGTSLLTIRVDLDVAQPHPGV
jgi:deazaflavin-dependent oxidoreductase (nitroreductase family)